MEEKKLNASKVLYEAAKQTWNNRKEQVITPNHDFSGIRYINVSNLPEGTILSLNSDGTGTKVEVSERLGNHSTLAYDLFAMVCDDAVAKGLEPVLVTTVLDVKSLKDNEEFVSQLAQGYVAAAKAANVAVINGETAELSSRVSGYGKFNYNWSATVASLGNESRIITGEKIRPCDYLVGLEEKGFRSNGLTLTRKTLEDFLGQEWHQLEFNPPEKNPTLGELVLKPSTIYTQAIVDMFGGWNLERKLKAEIHGIAHITGSGIPEKLGRILRVNNFGAIIDNPYKPSELMIYCQDSANIADETAYTTWNMGQGMIIVTPEPDKVMQVAYEHSINSKVIGKVKYLPGIKIKSQGVHLTNQYISF